MLMMGSGILKCFTLVGKISVMPESGYDVFLPKGLTEDLKNLFEHIHLFWRWLSDNAMYKIIELLDITLLFLQIKHFDDGIIQIQVCWELAV